MNEIRLRRVYDPPGRGEGKRFLVERLWPRGVKKEMLAIDGWLRDVAPSTELRKWFSHDPARWAEFRRRYQAELADNQAAWRPLLEAAREGAVTLLYSSRDTEHNNAVALRAFLERKRASRPRVGHAAERRHARPTPPSSRRSRSRSASRRGSSGRPHGRGRGSPR
ncbi:MAG TPA: DUF488 domain-containing protein [Planctomycetota bacterium]|nr:DUF488 domain-containing protein [Planctomycetota bacterium]